MRNPIAVWRDALLVSFVVVICLISSGRSAAAAAPNILFIPVDDLNHWVGYTGRNPQCKTPNIDRLAAIGVSFTNAQCAAPACGPSRAALWSGLRPHTSGCYLNSDLWKRHVDHEHDPYEFKNLAEKSNMAAIKKRLAVHIPKKNRNPTKTGHARNTKNE